MSALGTYYIIYHYIPLDVSKWPFPSISGFISNFQETSHLPVNILCNFVCCLLTIIVLNFLSSLGYYLTTTAVLIVFKCCTFYCCNNLYLSLCLKCNIIYLLVATVVTVANGFFQLVTWNVTLWSLRMASKLCRGIVQIQKLAHGERSVLCTRYIQCICLHDE